MLKQFLSRQPQRYFSLNCLSDPFATQRGWNLEIFTPQVIKLFALSCRVVYEVPIRHRYRSQFNCRIVNPGGRSEALRDIIRFMSFLTKDIDAPFNALKAYRPDIDGLKALSILAVIFFHYLSLFVTGGFIGVDVFFVISGYLIGRSTFIELKLKTFRFGTYFARRAKRIFPSLIVLLLVLWILGFFILLPDEYKSLGKHIGAASIFISANALDLASSRRKVSLMLFPSLVAIFFPSAESIKPSAI